MGDPGCEGVADTTTRDRPGKQPQLRVLCTYPLSGVESRDVSRHVSFETGFETRLMWVSMC